MGTFVEKMKMNRLVFDRRIELNGQFCSTQLKNPFPDCSSGHSLISSYVWMVDAVLCTPGRAEADESLHWRSTCKVLHRILHTGAASGRDGFDHNTGTIQCRYPTTME